MPSWQGTLLKAYFRVQRLLRRPTGELDIGEGRAELEALAAKFKSTVSFECTSVVANGVSAEWIVLPNVLTERVILYLHGGSYTAGSINSHRHIAASIADAAQARALIIDYRLAPENPYPAAAQDAIAAYRWLLTNDVAPNQIAVAGDSAGGGLVLSILVSLRDAGEPLPAAVVCLSPWTDLAATGESWTTKARAELIIVPDKLLKSAQLYLGNTDPYAPLASPLYADLRGLPPLLIQVGADEVLLSDSTRLAERARAAGTDVTLEVWEGMQHGWQLAANLLPEGQQAIDRIGEFVKQFCAR